MEKLDRLGWASGICFESFGLKIGIRCNLPELPADVLDCLPPGWKRAEPPFVDLLYSLRLGKTSHDGKLRQFHLVYKGLTRIARSMAVEDAYAMLRDSLQLHVAENARNRVFVHAGVVGWKSKALVLPGKSFAGKSTLVAALLRAGASYFSDEYAVIDEHGLVHPFARKLSLRSLEGKPEREAMPEEFGSRTSVDPVPVGLIALTKYRQGGRWQPRNIKPAHALFELMSVTLPLQEQPQRSINYLQRVVHGPRHLKGLRGEADETAELLLTQMEAGS